MEENKNKSPHKVNTVIFIILFLIAILFEIYWIMTYPDEIFMLIGIGLVAIIMGFFAFEGIMDTYMEVQRQRYEQNEMLIKTQKALYLATKKNSAMLETKSEQNIEAIKYLVLKMSENQQQMTNLIRENNEEMAKRIETSGSDFTSSDISQLVDKLTKSNERLTKEVQTAVTVNELVKSNAELVKNVKEVLGQSVNTMSSVTEESTVDTEPVAYETPAYTEPVAYETPDYTEPVAYETPTYTESEVTEAFSYMEEEPEETMAEFESEIEIEEVTDTPVEDVSPTENVFEEVDLKEDAPTEDLPVEAEEETTSESPFEIPPDNGGMLSEEEIAALFANL